MPGLEAPGGSVVAGKHRARKPARGVIEIQEMISISTGDRPVSRGLSVFEMDVVILIHIKRFSDKPVRRLLSPLMKPR